ncbi:MAG: 2OG-Fe(II) oxygenase [Sandaracinaceae bacterium]
MESLIQEALSELVDADFARGPFATHWRGPASDLELEVTGVGEIRFPVSKATVQALRSVARPARFGRGEATVLDRRVRDTWVISKSRVKIDAPRWRRTLGPALDRIHEALRLARGTRLKARLHDLLVYEEGQFFLAHRDAEKTPDMVGTLVVLLPSSFEGGASVVTHEGERVVVRGSSKKNLTFLAFYSNCEHEVKPVEKGHRLALTYELRLEGAPVAERIEGDASDAVRKLVEEHFATPAPIGWREGAVPDRLVYLLDHEYTPRGLSWRRLKGVDAQRATMLRLVADKMDCDVYLATAEVHEQWSCEPEDFGYDRYRSRRRRDREVSTRDGEEHPPLTELHDMEIVLDHWLDVDDRATRDDLSAVEPGELCYSRPSDELTPFRFEHEGYMGNRGDTVDRWYHRAAVVMWPRSRGFVIRAKRAAAWAAARVRETIEAGEIDDAREMVRALLPHWSSAAKDATTDLGPDVLYVAHGLEDAELAAAWTAPLGLEHVSVPDALGSLVERYGADWLEERFDAWGQRPKWASAEWRATFQESLPELARAASMKEPAARAWLSRRLDAEHGALRDELSRAKGSVAPWYVSRAREATTAPFVAVLCAATWAEAAGVRRNMVDDLVRASSSDESRDWAIAVLRCARTDMTPHELVAAQLDPAVEAAQKGLKTALAMAPRAVENWSIDVNLGCKCELCRTLSSFLSNADERALSWPLAKHGRQHVHGQIDTHQLPVTHTTERRGSPYTLLLRKTDELFEREQSIRAQRERDLDWLATWPRPEGVASRRRSPR